MDMMRSEKTDMGDLSAHPFNKHLRLAELTELSAAILSDPANTEVHDAVFTYGKHLGLAFQIVDDVLDFVSTGEEFGKPVLNDLKTGVVTLP
eukprot:gene10156-15618_t